MKIRYIVLKSDSVVSTESLFELYNLLEAQEGIPDEPFLKSSIALMRFVLTRIENNQFEFDSNDVVTIFNGVNHHGKVIVLAVQSLEYFK